MPLWLVVILLIALMLLAFAISRYLRKEKEARVRRSHLINRRAIVKETGQKRKEAKDKPERIRRHDPRGNQSKRPLW